MGAARQVRFEAVPVAPVERTVEVVGHQADGLAADQGAAAAEQHGSAPLHLGVEEAAEAGPGSVEQYPLVAGRHAEEITHLGRIHPFDVAQQHDLALCVREVGQAFAHPAGELFGDDPGVDGVGPRLRWRIAPAGAIETALQRTQRARRESNPQPSDP
jgi:hypothetical protein